MGKKDGEIRRGGHENMFAFQLHRMSRTVARTVSTNSK